MSQRRKRKSRVEACERRHQRYATRSSFLSVPKKLRLVTKRRQPFCLTYPCYFRPTLLFLKINVGMKSLYLLSPQEKVGASPPCVYWSALFAKRERGSERELGMPSEGKRDPWRGSLFLCRQRQRTGGRGSPTFFSWGDNKHRKSFIFKLTKEAYRTVETTYNSGTHCVE